jgi:erythritol transport system ATP-binding protein
VAIVYVSHHLEEALEIADQVAVLRDGRLVGQAEAADVDIGWVVEHMVGRNPDDLFPALEPELGEELLRIEDLVVADPANPARLAVDHVSLRIQAGEVVGLYGLMGAGRTELMETLAGRLRPVSGRIVLGGTPIDGGSISDRIRLGMTLVPEDRQRDGLVQSMSVGQNLSLAGLWRFVSGPWVGRDAERDAVGRVIRDVTVKTTGPEAPITSLSGGNQQKVVLGKALLTEPRVLLLDEPTRGIDVGAKEEFFQLIGSMLADGMAILLVSSELLEVLGLADRVLVMHERRIVGELGREAATEERIAYLAAGGEAARVA